MLTVHLDADHPSNLASMDQVAESGLLDTELVNSAPDGSLLTVNNNPTVGSYTTNAAIENLVLPVDGLYRIEARS